MNNFEKLISVASELKHDELEALSERILEMLKISPNEFGCCADEKHERVCRRCNSKSVVKYGKDRNGVQRYKCRSCNTVFRDTSYSVVSKSRHDISVWKKYIHLLLNTASLVECARECSISVQTAFTWRHKILHALKADQDNRVLGGIVEIDDMFVGINYKGNHKHSKDFQMPRKAYKRGNDNKTQSGRRACVLCACERQGQVYAEVVGVGRASVSELNYAFNERLMKDCIALTDKAKEFKYYFQETPIELIQLCAHSNKYDYNSPPEIKGSYHIQNVNNLHRRFRRHMEKYNGVATKYLDHYLNLFVWIENHKKAVDHNLQTELIKSLHEKDSYITYSQIVKLPPVPEVA